MHNRRIVDDFSVLYSDDDTLFSLTRIGALNIFKARIERGDDLNRRTYCESHCIHLAADYGRLDFLNYFQELEVDLNLTDKFNNTALHRAISSREVEAALFLIEQGANINKFNSDGNSPLNLSLKFGFTIITNLLIERGARLNDKNVFGWTPLHFAVALGDIEILKTLCEAGANYTFIGKCNRYSALHLAADIGDIGIIEYFLSKRVDIDYRYESGYTILHTAVRNNHHDLARFLIENGAQVNLKTNKKNYSALDFAARAGNSRLINMLIQNGANFEIQADGKCRILELLIKYFPYKCSVYFHKKYIRAAKVIIKFMALRYLKTPPIFPEYFPYSEKLCDFWFYCQREIQKMDSHYLGNTTISQYKFIRALFNDVLLAKYLQNEEIELLTHNIQNHFRGFPIYKDIGRLISTGLCRGMVRKDVLNLAHYIKMENFTSKLPPEIIMKICDYLSINDLRNLIEANVKLRIWSMNQHNYHIGDKMLFHSQFLCEEFSKFS